MAAIAITYTFTNATTADATQVNQNFTDIINGLSDGTKDISVNAGTFAGNVSISGNTTIGNASSDDLTVTASLASSIPIKTTNSYDLGATSLTFRTGYFGTSVISPVVTAVTSVTSPLIIGGTTTTSSLTFKTTTGVGTTGADHIFVVGNNGATEAMRILNSGLVGIGRAPVSAQGTLQVGATGSLQNFATNPGTPIVQVIGTNVALDNGGQLRILSTNAQAVDLGGSLGFGGNYATNGSGIWAEISGRKENSTDSNTAGYLSFGTRATLSTVSERMRINSSGSVGIGTSTPLQTLEVLHSTGVYFHNSVTNNTQKVARIGSLSYANSTYFPLIWSTSSGAAGTNDSHISIGGGTGSGYAANSVVFYTATNDTTVTGTERMKIDKSGNVVINNAAIATNATDGFLYIPSCAGTPTGVPTTYTGRTAMVYDSTNNKMYIYNGAWKSVTLA